MKALCGLYSECTENVQLCLSGLISTWVIVHCFHVVGMRPLSPRLLWSSTWWLTGGCNVSYLHREWGHLCPGRPAEDLAERRQCFQWSPRGKTSQSTACVYSLWRQTARCEMPGKKRIFCLNFLKYANSMVKRWPQINNFDMHTHTTITHVLLSLFLAKLLQLHCHSHFANLPFYLFRLFCSFLPLKHFLQVIKAHCHAWSTITTVQPAKKIKKCI